MQYVKQANKAGHGFYLSEEIERLKWQRDQERLQKLLKGERDAAICNGCEVGDSC